MCTYASPGKNILLAWQFGPAAVAREALSDGAIVAVVLGEVARTLRLTGPVPPPEAVAVTRWGADPYSLGCYSCPVVATEEAGACVLLCLYSFAPDAARACMAPAVRLAARPTHPTRTQCPLPCLCRAHPPVCAGAGAALRDPFQPARVALAAPAGPRLHFAGEACAAEFPSTVHGAMASGVAAAAGLLREWRLGTL
jgi:monoamine oxidase